MITERKNYEIEYKPMGEIKEGDVLIGNNAAPTAVSEAYASHIPERMFRLKFGNGEVIQASGNHLWYCISTLDEQTHKNRIKQAKKSVVPRINQKRMQWLQKMATRDFELSPEVDAQFILEVMEATESTVEYTSQILRVLQSIGHVSEKYDSLYDEKNYAMQSFNDTKTKLYSLRLFCEQMLALIQEASGNRATGPYDLLIGKVRTTEDIANTWDLGYTFPATGKKAGIFSKVKMKK